MAASRVYGSGKARDMYLHTALLLAAADMEGASCGCMWRSMRWEVVKTGSGMGESLEMSEALTSASMTAGCAGVGCCAIVGGEMEVLLAYRERESGS